MSSGSEHDGGARNPKKLPRSGQLDTAISSDRIRHSREHNGDSRTASSARSPGNNGSADIDLSISERSRNQQRPSREHYNSSLVDDGSGGVYNSDDTDDDSDGDIPARIPQSITRTPFVGNTPRPGCQWAPDTAYNQQRAAAQTAREGESGDGSKSHTRSPEVSNSIPPGASAISDAPPVAVSRTESRPDGAGRLAAAQSPRLTPARSGKEHARSPLRSNEAGSAQGTPSSSVSDPATALDPQSATMWELVRPHLVRTDKDHAPTKGYVRDFLKLPKVRELRWNTSWITKNPYVDAHPRDVSSLIMQITGEYAAQPCSKCQEGKGPYEGCVVISPRASPECQLMIVSCANCWYHSGQTYCSHQSMLKERFVALFPDVDVADFSHQVKSAARSGPRKPKGVSSRDTQPRQSKRPGRETNPEATALDQSQQLSTTSERLVTTESAAERATPATETVKSDEPRKEKETLEGRHGFTSDGNKVEAWPGESSLISTGFLGGLGNETLEMEEWEVAPGRIRSEGPNTMESKRCHHVTAADAIGALTNFFFSRHCTLQLIRHGRPHGPGRRGHILPGRGYPHGFYISIRERYEDDAYLLHRRRKAAGVHQRRGLRHGAQRHVQNQTGRDLQGRKYTIYRCLSPYLGGLVRLKLAIIDVESCCNLYCLVLQRSHGMGAEQNSWLKVGTGKTSR